MHTTPPFRIDLHVHSGSRSPCAAEYDEPMVFAAIERGLNGIAFTDHNRLMPEDVRVDLNRRYAPFRVYSGIEVSVAPSDAHILVFGVQDPALESGDWPYENLHKFVHDRGGYLILAHPFRYEPTIGFDIEALPPDGIELLSPNVPPEAFGRIGDLASRLALATYSHSDGHGIRSTGGFFNSCARLPADNNDLLRALKAREFAPSMDFQRMRPQLVESRRPLAERLCG